MSGLLTKMVFLFSNFHNGLFELLQWPQTSGIKKIERKTYIDINI